MPQSSLKRGETLKRGQVTIFFAIGLVLLIVILLYFYARNAARPPEQTTSGAITAEAHQYLGQCLEVALYNSLDTLTTNGGVFFDDHDLANFPSATLANGKKKVYGIVGPSITLAADAGIVSGNLFDMLDTSGSSSYGLGYTSTLFGTITLPALCDSQGPNKKSQTTHSRCPHGTYAANPHSIQAVLASKLTQSLITCIEQDVDIEVGSDLLALDDPEVEIIFSKRGIITKASFGEELVIEQQHDVRLLALYGYLHERLVRNTRDPRLVIEDDPSSPSFQSGFAVVEQPIATGKLYTFFDNNPNFKYRGTSLAFSFVVDDRPPFFDNDGACADPDGDVC